MKKLISGLVPGFIKKWRSAYIKKEYLKMLKTNPPQEVFKQIYEKNLWGDPESVSGGGSNYEQTAQIAMVLPALLKKYNVSSFLDLPCGDFHWMQNIDLNGIDYIGADIVKPLIQSNQQKYSKKGIDFKVIDLLHDKLPEVDMMLCRDCFIHLSNKDVLQGLENIKKSNIRYLLATSFVDRLTNTDILTGQWRALNLLIAPFNLRAIEVLNEKCTEGSGEYADKSLILIDMGAVRNN